MRLIGATLATLMGVVAGPAHAQNSGPSSSAVDTFRQRAPAPLPPLPKFDLRLQAPEKSPVTRAIDEISFEVRKVEVVGASAYSRGELEAEFASVRGKRVSLSALHAIAERIEARYSADDYFLTRVFIPPQRIRDGVVQIKVIEGKIGAVFLEGGTPGVRSQIEAQLAHLTQERPIRLQTLERAILMAGDVPGVTATGLLRPGAAQGESDLVLTVSDLPDSKLVGQSNAGANPTGPWSVSAFATLNKPFGLEGQLSAGLSTAPDGKRSQSVFARYSRSIWRPGTTVSLGVVASRSQPRGALSSLDNVSTSTSVNPRLRQALLRSRANSLYMDVALSFNRAKTEYLDTPVSDDRSTVAEATLTWQGVDPLGNVQASLSYFQGTKLAGAIGSDAPTPSVLGFEPNFKKWGLNFNRTFVLPANLSLLYATQTQYTKDILLSGETMAFGGSYIGRGYDPAVISGDSGSGGLLELRHDQVVNLMGKPVMVQPYAFVDLGITSSNLTKTVQRLRSTGLGLRLSTPSVGSVDLMLARALIPIETVDPRPNPRLVLNSTLRF